MRKILGMTALILSFTSLAQAKSEALIIVDANNSITLIDKATKIPANVLFTEKICYKGAPEEVEQIILKTVKNRKDYSLAGFDAWEYLGKVILTAMITTDRLDTVEVRMEPCRN